MLEELSVLLKQEFVPYWIFKNNHMEYHRVLFDLNL